LWSGLTTLIERTLRFLTGDVWRLAFRPRQEESQTLVEGGAPLPLVPYTSVCLFSGGLDSFVGAIDLLDAGKNPLFVSHYWDVRTSSQKLCAERIASMYGDNASCAGACRVSE
jgi:hypothetical protein